MAKLFTTKSLANGAGKLSTPPNRIKIFNWGKNATLKGDIIVNSETARVFADNQKRTGHEQMALDYEHNLVPTTTAYKESKDPRPVAGHFTAECIPGDGVYLNMTDWTPSGMENWKNYADLSPAPYVDEDNVLIGLFNCALTQAGAVEGLTFLSSDTNLPVEIRADLVTLSVSPQIKQKTKNMEPNTLKALRAILSMDDDGTDATNETAVCKAFALAVESGKITKVGPLDDAAGFAPKALSADAIEKMVTAAVEKITKPLTLSVTELTTAQALAKKAADKEARDAQVKLATAQGKVIPLSAETIATMPIPALTELVAGLPKSNLATKATPPAVIKAGEKGAIKGGARQVLTLNTDGTISPVEIAAVKGKVGLSAVSEGFQAQIQALKATRAA